MNLLPVVIFIVLFIAFICELRVATILFADKFYFIYSNFNHSTLTTKVFWTSLRCHF